jgi:hypothetical protein
MIMSVMLFLVSASKTSYMVLAMLEGLISDRPWDCSLLLSAYIVLRRGIDHFELRPQYHMPRSIRTGRAKRTSGLAGSIFSKGQGEW